MNIKIIKSFSEYQSLTRGRCIAVTADKLPAIAQYVGTLYDGPVVRHVYAVDLPGYPSEYYEVSSWTSTKSLMW